MKKLWVAIVAVLVLCLGSWASAIECEHYECCERPGECWECGETGVELAYTAHFEIYKNLGDSHQKYCSSCKIVLEEENPHNVTCGNPTYCTYCRANDLTVSEDLIVHFGITEWVDLGNGSHQEQCGGCGKRLEMIEKHLVMCTSPGVCMKCNATDIATQPTHAWYSDSTIVDIDSVNHYLNCIWCDTLLGIEHDTYGDGDTCSECGYLQVHKHFVTCDQPDFCKECGSGVTGYSRVEMYHKADGMKHNDAAKRSVCGTCGICIDYAGFTSYNDGYWLFENKYIIYPGDADGNGSVTLDDAIAILSDNVSSEPNADVNADGQVDELDVLRIMQYFAGWDVTLE